MGLVTLNGSISCGGLCEEAIKTNKIKRICVILPEVTLVRWLIMSDLHDYSNLHGLNSFNQLTSRLCLTMNATAVCFYWSSAFNFILF